MQRKFRSLPGESGDIPLLKTRMLVVSFWSEMKFRGNSRFSGRDANDCFVLSFIHLFFTNYGCISNSQCDQLLAGLIEQLVEQYTGIAEVMGSNPVQARTFVRFNFPTAKLCV